MSTDIQYRSSSQERATGVKGRTRLDRKAGRLARVRRWAAAASLGLLFVGAASAQKGDGSGTSYQQPEDERREEERRYREEAERHRERLRELEERHRVEAERMRKEAADLRRELQERESEARERARVAAREEREARERYLREVNSAQREAERARLDAARAHAAEARARALALRESRPVMALLSERPRIGVTVRDARGEGLEVEGAEVESVRSGGPAEEAGLLVGDVVVEVAGESLASDAGDSSPEGVLADGPAESLFFSRRGPADRLVRIVRELPVGEPVKMAVSRDGERIELEVVPRALESVSLWPEVPAPPAPSAPVLGTLERIVPAPAFPQAAPLPDVPMLHFFGQGPWHDLETVPVSEALGDYFGVDEGLLVITAPSDEMVALRAGDVILRIGNREPNDVRHAMRILGSYEPGENIEVTVMRHKKRVVLEGRVPEKSRLNRLQQGLWPALAPIPDDAPVPSPAPEPSVYFGPDAPESSRFL